MGKRKTKQPKFDTPPKKESKEVPEKEEPPQASVPTSEKESEKATKDEKLPETSVQAPSPPSTEKTSGQCFMPCGCPDDNAPENKVTFGEAGNLSLPAIQLLETSTVADTVCRLPPVFGLYHGLGGALFIRLSRKETTLFFLSLKSATYDPTPSLTLSRHRDPVVGDKIVETSPLATAAIPKPPHETSLDIDIRLYDPESPTKRNDELPVLHEKAKTGVITLSIKFDYQVPGCESKERFVWSYDRGPEIRSLKGGRSGFKLVRYQTRAVIGAWTGPRSSMSETKQGKMAFFDRNLGAQFEFLAMMSLIAHKATKLQRAYASPAITYGPESQYWGYASSAYSHPSYGHLGYRRYDNGFRRFGNTGYLDSQYSLLGF